MAGYYSTRLATGAHDDLLAKAIVLESGGVKVSLTACDLLGLPAEITAEARRLASAKTGIPAQNIMISATHTHTGPVLSGGSSWHNAFGGDLEAARRYTARLPELIAQAIEQANAQLVPARVLYGLGREETLGFNRRFFMKDGTVGWNPGKLNPMIVRPAGPVDREVPVVFFEAEDGRPLAVYVNFAVHLDTVGGTQWSADYPYTLSKILADVYGPDLLTLFTIGCAGNVNHLDVTRKQQQKGHAEAARIGSVLAAEVLKVMTRLQPAAAGPLRVSSEILQLDLARIQPEDVDAARAVVARLGQPNPPTFLETVHAFKVLDVHERAGKPLAAEVQVIALGDDIAWVALPGEVFAELGMEIKRRSPFRLTIVGELGHGPTTYFPDLSAFPQGNYEVVTSRAAPGSGERMVESAVRQLTALSSPKSIHRSSGGMIERITPPGVPAPRGPYSPAVRAGDFIYVAGQGPIDPKTNEFSFGDIKHETRLVLNNIKAILEGAGASLRDVVKCSVFLADGRDFAAMNEVYAEFFGDAKPARTTVEAKFAVPQMKVEIDCIAYKPQK